MKELFCGNHELLQSLAEGTLAADLERAVKAHVASCAACRATVREYKEIMWDLERPPEVPLPPELERSYEALMQAWTREQQKKAAPARASGSLVPSWATSWATSWAASWAAHSVSWTRNLPAAGAIRSLLRRTGGALVERSLPRWMRRKGGERH